MLEVAGSKVVPVSRDMVGRWTLIPKDKRQTIERERERGSFDRDRDRDGGFQIINEMIWILSQLVYGSLSHI